MSVICGGSRPVPVVTHQLPCPAMLPPIHHRKSCKQRLHPAGRLLGSAQLVCVTHVVLVCGLCRGWCGRHTRTAAARAPVGVGWCPPPAGHAAAAVVDPAGLHSATRRSVLRCAGPRACLAASWLRCAHTQHTQRTQQQRSHTAAIMQPPADAPTPQSTRTTYASRSASAASSRCRVSGTIMADSASTFSCAGGAQQRSMLCASGQAGRRRAGMCCNR
jgi:hypothetical protein